MGRIKWQASLAVAATALLACGGQLSGSGGASSGQPIVVDLVGTFSGQNADLGSWAWNGVKLAVDGANAKGGVSGRRLQLQKYDDQGQPTIGSDLAQRAVSDRATMGYGSDLSTVTLAMV